MSPTPDPIMAEILAAVRLLHSGDRTGARGQFEAIWARIGGDPEPLHECVLSHYMADAQDDLADELAWDLRALDAALRCPDIEWLGQPLSIPSFMPSAHANLAEDYLKLGDIDLSRHHLALAQQFIGYLADDAYGQLVRRGVEGLARKLDAVTGESAA